MTPWSDFWDRNYFTDLVPGLGALLRNNFARGGVTGVGLLTVMAGLAELGDVLSARREGDQPTGDNQAGPS